MNTPMTTAIAKTTKKSNLTPPPSKRELIDALVARREAKHLEEVNNLGQEYNGLKNEINVILGSIIHAGDVSFDPINNFFSGQGKLWINVAIDTNHKDYPHKLIQKANDLNAKIQRTRSFNRAQVRAEIQQTLANERVIAMLKDEEFVKLLDRLDNNLASRALLVGHSLNV